jgi:hypothetical protein
MSAGNSSHTVVLIQFTADDNSRTYLDFESINDSLDGIVQIFEQKLRQVASSDQQMQQQQITYSLADLINYVDKLADCCCLTYNEAQKVYVPHGRDWIKSKIYMALKRQAK